MFTLHFISCFSTRRFDYAAKSKIMKNIDVIAYRDYRNIDKINPARPLATKYLVMPEIGADKWNDMYT